MKFSSFLFLMLFFSATLRSQTIAQNTASSKNTIMAAGWKPSKAFIENKGQFDGRNWRSDREIRYGIDYNGFSMFFNKEGFTYRLDKFIRTRKDHESGSVTEPGTPGKRKPKWTNISELITTTWIESNANVKIEAYDQAKFYFSYTFRRNGSGEYVNENHIDGFNRIVYKNLYPNVDVDYEIHAEKGIKYNIVLHPGANPSKIRLKYESTHTRARSEYIKYFLDQSGNFVIKTSLDEITELKPYAYYKDSGKEIKVNFRFEKNTLSFELAGYDHTREVIIDPWVVNSTFNASTAVWEVETDASGNVYVIGGETPMTLQKYTSAGSLVWSHPTPWDTASVWLGTLATDDVGTSFITSGTAPEMQRVDNTGATVWTQTGPSGLGGDGEWWSITFNCDKTKLIVGGTTLLAFQFVAYATIFDMDINSGNVNATQYLDTADLTGFGSNPIEVRSISSSKNAKYIFLTHNDVGAINQNIGACPTDEPVFQLDNGHNLSYKCENYLPASQNGGGLKAIVANDQFFYTSSGAMIYKRSLSNGTLITSATIPSGANSTDMFGKKVVENSGLAVDSCGNVYAGSKGKVIKFDKDLNILSQATVSFTVYDVSVNANGEVIAVGAQSDNAATNRNGKIESINMGACTQYALVCCDANICPTGDLCLSSSAVTLSTTTPGGTFSGQGITNSSTGIFDPSVAGVGTHTVIYSQSCGSDSVEILVSSCLPLTACQESNGNITATSGNAPYTWYQWTPGTTINITDANSCAACGGTWFVFQCLVGGQPATSCTGPAGWTQFGGTNATVTPAGNWPILVVDADNDSLQIPNLASLPNCSGCTPPTATTSSTATSCGLNNGTASVTASGGTSPYTYLWSNGQTTASVSGLASGTYSVTVTGGGCDKITTVTVAASSALSATATSSNTTCGNNNGSVTVNASGGSTPYTYSWAGGQTTQSITGLAAGTYNVTITAGVGCTTTASGTVNSSTGVTATTTPSPASCGGSNGSAIANPSGGVSPYTYLWSNSQTTQTATGLAAGNYSVTITDNTSCTVTATASISNTGGPTVTTSFVDASCGGNNGSATVTPAGGTSPYTYSWNTNPVQTTSTATGLSAGTYNVTVTDASTCVATASVTVSSSAGPTATTSVTDASCNGGSTGSATVTPAGGTTPYTYLWSNSQTTQTATGLAAGTYTVTFTDANSCTGNASVTVAEPPAITATTSSTTASCGQADGSATVSPSGGNSPYTYLWAANANSQTTATATGLAASSYAVTITDASGCTVSVTASVSNANAPVATATSSDPLCSGGNNGSASVSATGGATPYTYTWSTTPPQTTTNATGLSAGTYSVTVSDFAGCNAISTVTLNNPAPISVQVTSSPNDTTCSGVPVTLTAFSSGASPSTYLWNDPANSTTSSITVTPSTTTTYMVTATDNNGCVADTSFTIVMATAAVTISKTCSGSTATLTATSGNSYLWSTNETTQSIVVDALVDSVYSVTVGTICGPLSASDTVTGVDAVVSNDTTIGFGATIQIVASGGSNYLWSTGESGPGITVSPQQSTVYIVTVTDPYGCSDYDTISITVECRHEISVPTIFSPNHDGINDFIKIHGFGFTELNLVIYDRWGEKVFETTDKSISWDGTRKGKELNAAVFVYVLDVTFCDGVEYNEKGNITLIK